MSQPQVFREVFQHVSKDLLHWFPGHMAKGKMPATSLAPIDCLIVCCLGL